MQLAPLAAWVEASHAPRELLSASGRRISLEHVQGKKVAAFCGIGNPAGFRHTLRTLGYDVAAFREFADHHPYSRQDISSLDAWAQEHGAAAIITTHKDLVKIGIDQLGSLPLWAVTIGVQFLAGQEELEAKLLPLLPQS
jgi:tetraacyldisaccharide 4'-kinase